MQGSPNVIATLNRLLSLELSSISQYIVHAEMCENWGYEKLDRYIKGRAIVEMGHADALIGRILFLQGVPVVSNPPQVAIGGTVEAMHKNDRDAELRAIAAYNEAIAICVTESDAATRDLLERLVADEDSHVNAIESNLDQVRQMGAELYLSTQV